MMFTTRAIVVGIGGASLAAATLLGAGPASASPGTSTHSVASSLSSRFRPPPPPPTTPPPPSCGGEQPLKPDGSAYACTFTDDFSGSTLDSTKWITGETAKTGFATGSDCYINDPSVVSVSGDQLHLSSTVAASPFICKSPYGNFSTSGTAGSVLTYGKFAQTYGRFEFRAKFPNTTAFSDSALWMYPQKSIYGAWPASGEIDVAEWFGTNYNDHVYPSVHYSGETGSTGYNCVVANASTAFHNYAVTWTSTTMTFYYDGQMCFQHSWTPSAPLVAPQPFDQPFDLVMTQTGAANQPVGSKLTMDVEWVRAWK